MHSSIIWSMQYLSALGNGWAGCLWPQSDTELVHIPITVVGHYLYLEYMQQEAHSLWDFLAFCFMVRRSVAG